MRSEYRGIGGQGVVEESILNIYMSPRVFSVSSLALIHTQESLSACQEPGEHTDPAEHTGLLQGMQPKPHTHTQTIILNECKDIYRVYFF